MIFRRIGGSGSGWSWSNGLLAYTQQDGETESSIILQVRHSEADPFAPKPRVAIFEFSVQESKGAEVVVSSSALVSNVVTNGLVVCPLTKSSSVTFTALLSSRDSRLRLEGRCIGISSMAPARSTDVVDCGFDCKKRAVYLNFENSTGEEQVYAVIDTKPVNARLKLRPTTQTHFEAVVPEYIEGEHSFKFAIGVDGEEITPQNNKLCVEAVPGLVSVFRSESGIGQSAFTIVESTFDIKMPGFSSGYTEVYIPADSTKPSPVAVWNVSENSPYKGLQLVLSVYTDAEVTAQIEAFGTRTETKRIPPNKIVIIKLALPRSRLASDAKTVSILVGSEHECKFAFSDVSCVRPVLTRRLQSELCTVVDSNRNAKSVGVFAYSAPDNVVFELQPKTGTSTMTIAAIADADGTFVASEAIPEDFEGNIRLMTTTGAEVTPVAEVASLANGASAVKSKALGCVPKYDSMYDAILRWDPFSVAVILGIIALLLGVVNIYFRARI